MKTRIFSLTGGTLAVATVGLLFATQMQGRQANSVTAEGPAADTNSIPSETASNPPSNIAVTLPPVTLGVPANQLAANNAQPAPTGVKLSKGATDIARFAQSGIGEDVMLAYIASVNSQFNLGSDQIVYLNDLGVTGNVVKAMIQRDAAITAAAQTYQASLTPPPLTNYYPPVPTEEVTDTSVPPQDPNAYVPTDDAEYFYTSLSPYGSWIYVAGFGLCWQPTVYLGNHEWRPYNDRGRWLYSDCGWYWQSDYSWGWAPFHYGRWFEDPRCGWVWCPDRVWSPAWVSWRSSGQYCGWAPLPPSARFVPGTGFVFRNHNVAAGFEFGLRPHHYTFIPLERMTDYTPSRYATARWRGEEMRDQTHVVTHMTEQNHHVFNHGVDPRAIAAVTGSEVHHAEIRDTPNDGRHGMPADHVGKNGNGLVIYRAPLPMPTHRPTGSAPIGQPGHNPNGPRSSATPSGPAHASAPAPITPNELTARVQMLQKHAVEYQHAQETARANQQPAATETYPVGSLVMHGDANNRPTGSTSHYATTTEAPGWQPNSPARSHAGYTVVNGTARPDRPQSAAPQNNQATHTVPGRFSVEQRMNGFTAPYSVANSPTPQLNSHAQQISEAANAQTMPGRFTAAQQLNNAAPVHNHAVDAPHVPANSHAEQMMQAASRSYSESRPQAQAPVPTHSESRAASYLPPPSAPSAPASHASSPAPSSSSGNNSSGKK